MHPKQKAKPTRFDMVKQRHKETYLTALSQGKVDEQMQNLCSFVAKTAGFYTSSCCSGRIMLQEKRGESKKDNFFHRKWHRQVKEEELLEGLEEKVEGDLWFKLEPFILHIGCETIEGANILLDAMKNAGVKRGGIIVAQPGKFLVELQGTNSIGFIVKRGGKKLVENAYVASILPMANEQLSKNYKRLEKLESELRKTLK